MKILTTGIEAILKFIHLLSKYCLNISENYKSSEYDKLKDVKSPPHDSVLCDFRGMTSY